MEKMQAEGRVVTAISPPMTCPNCGQESRVEYADVNRDLDLDGVTEHCHYVCVNCEDRGRTLREI